MEMISETYEHQTSLAPPDTQAVDSDTGLLTLTEPIHVDIQQKKPNARLQAYNPITEVGLESLRYGFGQVEGKMFDS